MNSASLASSNASKRKHSPQKTCVVINGRSASKTLPSYSQAQASPQDPRQRSTPTTTEDFAMPARDCSIAPRQRSIVSRNQAQRRRRTTRPKAPRPRSAKALGSGMGANEVRVSVSSPVGPNSPMLKFVTKRFGSKPYATLLKTLKS